METSELFGSSLAVNRKERGEMGFVAERSEALLESLVGAVLHSPPMSKLVALTDASVATLCLVACFVLSDHELDS